MKYGIALTVRTVGKYLARWGFAPQKPIKKAYEQCPEAVQAWLDEEYPAIEAQARAQGAEIHCGDETALVNTDVRSRSYAPAGKTPVAFALGGERHKLSMIATVTNQGKARWMSLMRRSTRTGSSSFLGPVRPSMRHRFRHVTAPRETPNPFLVSRW